MVGTILKLESVSKSFGKHEVLKDISFDVEEGEIFGVIGPSGSGKTTLLNVMSGFLAPKEGNVSFKSDKLLSFNKEKDDPNIFRSVIKFGRDVKKTIGFASQEASFYKKLTLLENLDLFGSMYGLSRDARKTNSLILLKLILLFYSLANSSHVVFKSNVLYFAHPEKSFTFIAWFIRHLSCFASLLMYEQYTISVVFTVN